MSHGMSGRTSATASTCRPRAARTTSSPQRSDASSRCSPRLAQTLTHTDRRLRRCSGPARSFRHGRPRRDGPLAQDPHHARSLDRCGVPGGRQLVNHLERAAAFRNLLVHDLLEWASLPGIGWPSLSHATFMAPPVMSMWLTLRHSRRSPSSPRSPGASSDRPDPGAAKVQTGLTFIPERMADLHRLGPPGLHPSRPSADSTPSRRRRSRLTRYGRRDNPCRSAVMARQGRSHRCLTSAGLPGSCSESAPAGGAHQTSSPRAVGHNSTRASARGP
jgi:hypothetical protein